MIDEVRFDSAVVRGLVRLSDIAGWSIAVASAAFLLAWISGTGPLLGLIQTGTGPRAAAAMVGTLSGMAVVLLSRAQLVSMALSGIVLIMSFVDLLHFLTAGPASSPHWLDRFVAAGLNATGARMTELAPVAFLLVGLAGLATAAGRLVPLRNIFALAVVAISMSSCASWGIVLAGDSASLLQRLPITTASALLVLALSWIVVTPTSGLARIVSADSQGGMLARRLLLPALLLPVLLTFVFGFAKSRLGVSESLALALAAAATGCTVASLIALVAVLLDRSERQRRTVQHLRIDANTDALTGVANRRAFDQALQAMMKDERRRASTALLLIDLDHFKSFNDSFGHQAGDDVLRETGRILRESVRPEDLVARFGGEEFVILLPECDESLATRVGERILEKFRRHAWTRRRITASIGASTASGADDAETLVQRADDALYRSKFAGRDRLTMALGPDVDGDALPDYSVSDNLPA